MKELKGEPTHNCYTCQYRKRMGSPYRGIKIRNPDAPGKCCRAEGLCDRKDNGSGYLGGEFKKRNFPTEAKRVESRFDETPLFRAMGRVIPSAQLTLFGGENRREAEK